jgi:tetratricopeptide (TPR) repeat protein
MGHTQTIQAKGGAALIGRISSYLEIVNRDPHSTAFVPLAEVYREIGLLDYALEVARLGTRMLPHHSPGFETLGRILGQMGYIDEAMSAYGQALSIDAQDLPALLGLARLHLVRGERAEARRILSEAAQYHPEDEMVENMLLALDLPRPLGGRLPTLPDAPAAMTEAAPAAPAAAVDDAPIPTATLAEIYLKQGLVDQAIRVYREILRLEPGNATALRRLRELCPPPAPATLDTAASPRKQRQPLEILEDWLQRLQTRRAHVQ